MPVKCTICKKKRPSFNEEGEITATHCGDCKTSTMVNAISKMCIICKKKQPTFNNEGETSPTHCGDCKTFTMVNVANKKCIVCKKKIPSFNEEGQTSATHCADCKTPEMIDIKHKICLEKNCIKRQIYGYIGNIRTRCPKHKLPGMFKKPNTPCENCKELATYGITNPKHCEDHKTSEEICLLVRTCGGCNRESMILNNEGLCLEFCKPDKLFQEQKMEKKWEKMVLTFLDQHIPLSDDIKIMDDSIIDNSCNKRRPDRAYDCGKHFVFVEVDEEQHKGYSKEKNCELVRMHQIYESTGLIPVDTIFLRFNPHNYRVDGKIQKPSMKEKLSKLVLWVKECLAREDMGYGCIYKKLYYDEFKETDKSFETVDSHQLF
jgi:hypothetical protein